MQVSQPTAKEGRMIEGYEALASAILCMPVRATDDSDLGRWVQWYKGLYKL
jgi:hypothetical protein